MSQKNPFVAQKHRARISVTLSQFTVPLLSRIYHEFDGDIVLAIVLGEIAHRNVVNWLSNIDNPEEPLNDVLQHKEVMRPCNALSIAEACGLPRETVRRKVVTLVERGLIYRSKEGHLFLTPSVGDNFQDMTADVIEALLATARQLGALLGEHKGPIGALDLQPRMRVKPKPKAERPAPIRAKRAA